MDNKEKERIQEEQRAKGKQERYSTGIATNVEYRDTQNTTVQNSGRDSKEIAKVVEKEDM